MGRRSPRSTRPAGRLLVPILLLTLAGGCAPRAPAPAPGQEDRIRRVEAGLLTHNVVRGEDAPLYIRDRMAFYRVPGVSVAVIDSGRIAWARGWGVLEAGGDAPVDTTTLFQAASISKPVAAAAVLTLVQDGLLDLDADVNDSLRSWRVPDNGFTTTEKVTLRRLLTHNAGTTVHGFPGYAAGADLPTLVQVLDGAPPANTAPVGVDTIPGSLVRYSGGGTSIAQLLMTDVVGQPFDALMQERVLGPAGMTRSTYAQPLPPARRGEAATAHRGDGTPVPGAYHTYPEQAAAGLWTTPSDLARFALDIQAAFAGDTGRVLAPDMARQMLSPQVGDVGIGFFLEGEADDLLFHHGGSNAGFRAFFAALASRGQGVVVMTNGDGGASLAQEILRAVAREYDLPGFRPNERVALDLGPARLAEFTGAYTLAAPGAGPDPVATVHLDGATLRIDVPRFDWTGRTLRAYEPDTFFFLENTGEIAFERADDGTVVAAVVTGLGQPARLERQ